MIYACRGTFSGGMEDNSTKSLCNVNDGFHICEDAIEAVYHGLTYSVCNNTFPFGEVYFIQETSNGYGLCYSQYPQTGNKEDGPRNDIWGCGGWFCGHPVSCYGLLPNFCNSYQRRSGLELGSDHEYEYDYVSITNASRGGVVCCPPDTLAPTTSPSITSQAQFRVLNHPLRRTVHSRIMHTRFRVVTQRTVTHVTPLLNFYSQKTQLQCIMVQFHPNNLMQQHSKCGLL